MKRILTIIGILIVILCFSFWGLHHIQQIKTDLSAQCAALSTLPPEQRQEALDELNDYWSKEKEVLECFLHHHTIDKISDGLKTLQSTDAVHDEVYFQITLANVELLFHRLYEDEFPSPENVL